MRNIFKIIIPITILTQSCINQKVTESEVFNPTKEHQIADIYTFTRHFITNTDTTSLEAWHLTEPNAEFNLIYCSGNGSNIRSAIPLFNELGNQFDLNIFSFNYSGYGLSDGNPSIEGIVKDGQLAIDYFVSDIGSKNLPTIVLGYSLGGYVALHHSDNEYIDKLILMSTFTSLEELEKHLIKEALPGIIRPFLNIELDPVIYKLSNLELIKTVEKPLLILHGESDKFIPPTMGETLYGLGASKNKHFALIENADHRMILKDLEKTKLVVQEIQKFIYQDKVNSAFISR